MVGQGDGNAIPAKQVVKGQLEAKEEKWNG